MADLVINIEIDASSVPADSKKVRDELSAIGEEAEKLGKKFKSLAAPDFSVVVEQLREFAKILKQIGGNSEILKTISDNLNHSSLNAAITDARRYQQSRAKIEHELTDVVTNEAERQYQARLKSFERGVKQFQKVLDESKKPTQGQQFQNDLFGTIFGATTLSGLAVNGITALAGKIKSLISDVVGLGVHSVELAGDFQQTTNALEVATGSARLANQEIKAIDETAQNTTGLRLESAEQGYTRLRNLGFQAESSRLLIAGLAKEKIISRADEQSVDRVIVNLTQLAAGSSRASQDIREIIHAMPSLRNVFQEAFGTLNPQEISKLFANNPDAAIEKFAKAMEKAKQPAGGLNDALNKLSDAGIQTGRTFGQPIVEPLTQDVKELSAVLLENADKWQYLGQKAGDALTGIGVAVQAARVAAGGTGGGLKEDSQTGLDLGLGLLSPALAVVSALGKKQREYEDLRKSFNEQFQNFNPAAFNSQDSTIDFSKAYKSRDELAAESYAAELRAEIQKENIRQRDIASLKDNAEIAKSILKNRYQIEQALLDSHLRLTTADELNYTRQLGASKANEYGSQIGQVKGYYDKLIALAGADSDDAVKLTLQKNKEIGDLNAQSIVNEYQTLKHIAEIENKILEERRKAQIDFKDLQIKESQTALDVVSNNIERQISLTGKGYSELIDAAQNSYQQIRQITVEQNALELQDKTLTVEQRVNLEKKQYLDLQNLAEQNRQKITSISDRQYQEQLNKLEKFTTQVSDLYKNLGSVYSSIQSGFFNPDTFNNKTVDSFSETILKKSQIAQLTEQMKLAESQANSVKTVIDGIYSNAPKTDDIGGRAISDTQLQQIHKLQDAFTSADSSVEKFRLDIEKIQDSIPAGFNILGELANQIKGGNIQAFDEAAKKILDYSQQLERASLDSQISGKQGLIELAKTQGDVIKQKEYEIQLSDLLRQKEQQRIGQAVESNEQYANSLKGLKQQLNDLLSGSDSGTKYTAEQSFIREKIALVQENTNLEQGYYKDSEYLALQRKNKLLSYDKEVFELRQELANKSNFSQAESDAKVLQYLNENIKSVSESWADFRIGIAKGVLDQISSPFDALSKKLEGLPPIIKGLAQSFLQLANDIVRAFSQKLIMKLLGLDSSGSSSGGFNLGSIFGGNQGNGIFNFGGSNSPLGNLGSIAGGNHSNAEQLLTGSSSGGGSSNNSNAEQLLTGSSSGGGGGSNLAGTLGLVGAGAGILGGLLGGTAGTFISSIGSGIGLGASIGSIIPGLGTVVGAVIGGAVGLLGGIFSVFSNRSKDKKENLPQLHKGFDDAFEQLKLLAADKNAFYSDPDGAIAKAMDIRAQIASGFGVQFLSGKYKKQAHTEIAAKLREADDIIAQMQAQKDKAKVAIDIDQKLETSFATGVYMDRAFLKQYSDYKRRNGMLAGQFTGMDTLPSMLAAGEMVLNPAQIAAVINNAGGSDVFKGAGIPNYATGTYLPPSPQSGAISTSASALAGNNSAPPLNVTVVIEGEGISNAKIKDVIIDGFENDRNIQTSLVKNYDKTKSLRKD